MKGIIKWFREIQAELALQELASLERRRSFISPFFMGETRAKVELERHNRRMIAAREKYEKLKQYLD